MYMYARCSHCITVPPHKVVGEIMWLVGNSFYQGIELREVEITLHKFWNLGQQQKAGFSYITYNYIHLIFIDRIFSLPARQYHTMPVNQSLIPSLYPPHLGLPGVQILCYLSELDDWVLLCCLEHWLEVTDSRRHLTHHLGTLISCLRALVQSGSESEEMVFLNIWKGNYSAQEALLAIGNL